MKRSGRIHFLEQIQCDMRPGALEGADACAGKAPPFRYARSAYSQGLLILATTFIIFAIAFFMIRHAQ